MRFVPKPLQALAALAGIALLGTALAQPAPPPPLPPAPAFEELALIEGLSVEQQNSIHQLLSAQRQAHEELAQRHRQEQEAIDVKANKALRQALGEAAYVKFAQWLVQRRPGPQGGPGDGRQGPPGLPPPRPLPGR